MNFSLISSYQSYFSHSHFGESKFKKIRSPIWCVQTGFFVRDMEAYMIDFLGEICKPVLKLVVTPHFKLEALSEFVPCNTSSFHSNIQEHWSMTPSTNISPLSKSPAIGASVGIDCTCVRNIILTKKADLRKSADQLLRGNWIKKNLQRKNCYTLF